MLHMEESLYLADKPITHNIIRCKVRPFPTRSGALMEFVGLWVLENLEGSPVSQQITL